MPMFLAHVAISAGLIALVAGTAFLLWLRKQEAVGAAAKLVGYVVVFLSITDTLCASYYAVRYWKDGYFEAPFIITHDQKDMEMMHKKMMEHSGKMPMMGNPPSMMPASPQEHEEHHQ